MTVAALSEDALIRQLFAPIAGDGALGLRDDAALIPAPAGSELVLTVDTLVADVHFFRDDPPGMVARKALRVNLSDLAAKGADPIGFLLSLSLPSDTSLSWIAAFSEGLGADARATSCALLGGDTVRTAGPLTVSVTAIGRVPTGYMVKRTGARAGDILAVTGTIGDAALGLRLRLEEGEGEHAAGHDVWRDVLTPGEQAHLLQRYLLPEPRNAMALALREHASGAMDVSDGLIGDTQKMLAVSGVSGEIEIGNVPLSAAVKAAAAFNPQLLLRAVTGGDDYEVICTVHPDKFEALSRACEAAQIPLTAFGRVTEGDQPARVLLDGAEIALQKTSYSHF